APISHNVLDSFFQGLFSQDSISEPKMEFALDLNALPLTEEGLLDACSGIQATESQLDNVFGMIFGGGNSKDIPDKTASNQLSMNDPRLQETQFYSDGSVFDSRIQESEFQVRDEVDHPTTQQDRPSVTNAL